MTPRHLRAKARFTLEDIAARLSVSPAEVHVLEQRGVELWQVGILRSYLTSVGQRLKLVVTDDNGHEETVD